MLKVSESLAQNQDGEFRKLPPESLPTVNRDLTDDSVLSTSASTSDEAPESSATMDSGTSTSPQTMLPAENQFVRENPW